MGSALLSRRSALALTVAPLLRSVDQPLFEQAVLFRQGDGGVHTYRIPALLETSKGALLAVADARHDSSTDLPARISLIIRRSHDRGRTWTPPAYLRRVKEGGVGDPSLLLDRNTGRVWCFHAYGPPGIGFDTAKPGALTGATTLQFHAIHSDDEGATWSEPVDLTPQVIDRSWQGMFATSGTHIQTSRGRYLVPMVVSDEKRAVSSRNAYSDDAGKTWKIGPAIAPETDESQCVELADGTIFQNMRNNSKRIPRAVAFSADGGVTFGPVSHPPALIDPDCNAGFTRYVHGKRDVLIFTNPASSKHRENLTVKLSDDAGKTWSAGRVIHAKAAAYSVVIALGDGTVGMLYECGESFPAERIAFARFDLAWAEHTRA